MKVWEYLMSTLGIYSTYYVPEKIRIKVLSELLNVPDPSCDAPISIEDIEKFFIKKYNLRFVECVTYINYRLSIVWKLKGKPMYINFFILANS